MKLTETQEKQLVVARSNVLDMTVTQLQNEAEALQVIKITNGAVSTQEARKLVESRFNDKLTAIPLADWCKDHNRNKQIVFKTLRDSEYIDENNTLTNAGFGLLHDMKAGDDIKLENCVLFNTYATSYGKRVLMINPSSESYQRFKDVIGHRVGKYKGSKDFNAKKVCKAMRKLCPSYKIVE